MNSQDETPPITQSVDQSRRRLTKVGLAAPAVLGVLASRSVLGNSLHHCTPSGHISGFASPPPTGATPCSVGNPPSTYEDVDNWPTGFTDTDGNPLPFNLSPPGAGEFFLDAYVVRNNGRQIKRSATVLEVLKGEYLGDQDNWYLSTRDGVVDTDFSLGQEAIAACMNFMFRGEQGFPVTDTQVVKMFNNVINGKTDPVTSTANWNALEVTKYLQTLHT